MERSRLARARVGLQDKQVITHYMRKITVLAQAEFGQAKVIAKIYIFVYIVLFLLVYILNAILSLKPIN